MATEFKWRRTQAAPGRQPGPGFAWFAALVQGCVGLSVWCAEASPAFQQPPGTWMFRAPWVLSVPSDDDLLNFNLLHPA